MRVFILIPILILIGILFFDGYQLLAIRKYENVLYSRFEQKTEKIEAEISILREDITSSHSVQALDYSWVSDSINYVAHALGSVGCYAYTNSREALAKSLENGFCLFETDLHLTAEGALVLYHDKERYAEMIGAEVQESDQITINYQDFNSSLLYDQFHTTTLIDLLNIMDENKNIYVIIDWGAPAEGEDMLWYSGLAYLGSKYDNVLDRIVVEIRSEAQLINAAKVYPWKSYALAYYENYWLSQVEAINFCNRYGIKVVDIPVSNCTEEKMREWIENGINVFAYTVNDKEHLEELAAIGVKGIYTDMLLPK